MKSAPVFSSLNKPLLFAGLPRKYAIMIATITMAIVFGLGQIWFIAISLVLFIAGAILTKEDEYFFDIFFDLIKLPDKAF